MSTCALLVIRYPAGVVNWPRGTKQVVSVVISDDSNIKNKE